MPVWMPLAVIDSIAVHLGPLEVRWYGIIIVTAILMAVWLSTREAVRLGENPEIPAEAAVWVVPAGIIGARLYEVFVLQWAHYSQHLSKIPAIWEGGLAIHGAVIGGALTLIIFVAKRQLDVWKWLDIIGPSVLAAQALGRWGNFFNQEAYGQEAPTWVMNLLPGFMREQMFIADKYYPHGAYMHPTFLYESLWNLAVFLLLMWFRRRNPVRGAVAMGYIALYSVGRYLIEGIRMDSSYVFGGVRVAQLVSLVLMVGAVLIILRRMKSGAPHYED